MPICITHKKKLVTPEDFQKHSSPECVIYTAPHDGIMNEDVEEGYTYTEGTFMEDVILKKRKNEVSSK